MVPVSYVSFVHCQVHMDLVFGLFETCDLGGSRISSATTAAQFIQLLAGCACCSLVNWCGKQNSPMCGWLPMCKQTHLPSPPAFPMSELLSQPGWPPAACWMVSASVNWIFFFTIFSRAFCACGSNPLEMRHGDERTVRGLEERNQGYCWTVNYANHLHSI